MNFRRLQELSAHFFEADDAGNLREKYAALDPATLPPLVLAYLGDACFHLFIRRRLLAFDRSNIQLLAEFSAKLVSAAWQAKAYYAIADQLDEREREIFRRGRNAQSRVPKSASVHDYRISTGVEALLGELYLTGKTQRLDELSELMFSAMTREIMRAKGNDVFENRTK